MSVLQVETTKQVGIWSRGGNKVAGDMFQMLKEGYVPNVPWIISFALLLINGRPLLFFEIIILITVVQWYSYSEEPNDTDEILIYDGCDVLMHTSCVGLDAVPKGDWLCKGMYTRGWIRGELQLVTYILSLMKTLHFIHVTQTACLEVLDAQRKSNLEYGVRDTDWRCSLAAKLPPLPTLYTETFGLAERSKKRFREEISPRKDAALNRLAEPACFGGCSCRWKNQLLLLLAKLLSEPKLDFETKQNSINLGWGAILCSSE